MMLEQQKEKGKNLSLRLQRPLEAAIICCYRL